MRHAKPLHFVQGILSAGQFFINDLHDIGPMDQYLVQTPGVALRIIQAERFCGVNDSGSDFAENTARSISRTAESKAAIAALACSELGTTFFSSSIRNSAMTVPTSTWMPGRWDSSPLLQGHHFPQMGEVVLKPRGGAGGFRRSSWRCRRGSILR